MTSIQNQSRKTVILGVCMIGILVSGYLGWHYDEGWIAHDEGLLGHTAELTLAGNTPHVEFQDAYTGLLSHINASSFKLFGINLASLRIPLLIGATMTAIVWYLIALRMVSPAVAGVVTLTSVAWSFPNYFAALPSWYVLMAASWTTWTLIKFHETSSRRYTLLAALFSGVAILFKIVGLYLVAASLFVIWISHAQPLRTESDRQPKTNTHLILSVCLAGIFTLMVGILIHKHLSLSTVAYFLIPLAAAMAIILESSQRFTLDLKDAVRNCLLFGITACVPLFIFALPYILQGNLDNLMDGLFELPKARLDHAAALPPNGVWCLASIPILLLTIFENKVPKSMILPLTSTIALCGACLCTLASTPLVYQSTFVVMQCSLPAIAVGAWYCHRKRELPMPAIILVIVTACLGITQYPYSSGIYFCYCAPFVLLTLIGVIGRTTTYDKPLWLTFIVLLAVFAVARVNYTNPRLIGSRSQHFENNRSLQTTRAKLKIESSQQQEYNSFLQIIEKQTTINEPILAGPDCPQFYFLSGRQNPTPQCYDLFRAYQLGGQSELETELKRLIETRDIQLVVHNRNPEFSKPYSPDFISWLESWGERSPSVGSGRFQIFIKNDR
ncbi:glycosyltransferase family 39 protein [Pirellulaceae bacterium]|nr:glycosyltransferase family 39 protein [Pirellulaceae bacterium]